MRDRSSPGPSGDLIVLALAATLFAAVVLVAWCAGVRVNLTPSHAPGVYRIVDRDPAVGLYALFCVPGALADLPPVDQSRAPPCTRDTPGYSILKRIERIEPDGSILVRGDHPRSLDSRIFGPLRRDDIRGVAVRVWGF